MLLLCPHCSNAAELFAEGRIPDGLPGKIAHGYFFTGSTGR
jgi:hypothetical protein